MKLELDPQEQELLQKILRSYRTRLQEEIFHTDARDFKSSLKEELEVLERLMARALTERVTA
jgi:hypothetical protein